jgi:hypothetical protein
MLLHWAGRLPLIALMEITLHRMESLTLATVRNSTALIGQKQQEAGCTVHALCTSL